MMGINIVLAVLAGLIFIWSSYKLLVANEDKYDTMTKYINSSHERLKTMKKNSEMSLGELDLGDTEMSMMTSDSDFSEFE